MLQRRIFYIADMHFGHKNILKATPHNSRRTAYLNLIPSACPKNLGKATALPQFICTT